MVLALPIRYVPLPRELLRHATKALPVGLALGEHGGVAGQERRIVALAWAVVPRRVAGPGPAGFPVGLKGQHHGRPVRRGGTGVGRRRRPCWWNRAGGVVGRPARRRRPRRSAAGSPGSWSRKATMRSRRVSNSSVRSSEEVRAGRNDPVRRPHEALEVGIGDVGSAAELGQKDGQLGCRQPQLVEIVHILSLAPSRRNTRNEHRLPVRGESACDVLARAAGLAFELVDAGPQFGFPILRPKLAGEVGHSREKRWLVIIRIPPIIVRARRARQLQAELAQGIMMHANDACLGHKLLVP